MMHNSPSDILKANLALLGHTNPKLASLIEQASPAPLVFGPARSGLMTASIESNGRQIALASRYDPEAEADKLASTVDFTKHAGIFVLGLGLGYHVAKIAGQLTPQCLMVVYEPDLGVLRAVFEKIDLSPWLGRPNVFVAEPDADCPALMARVDRYAAMLTQGTVLVTHPPTRQLQPDAINRFGKTVTEVLAYCRTNVVTSLVNASRTCRNLSLNLPYYAAGAGTDELFEAAKDYPAVCVGAGPSLAKNVDLLADPAVRDKVVVISAQTTLKPLLDRGIKPDFVTALDYHEISKRFYEGLPPLPDVTLVAEPQANPTILDHFPGPVRVTQHTFLDTLLGELAKPRIAVKYGATVAHLSFYLAQHLGCDPIILIGQDLGFSHGLYYCPGTAIHDVWAPELGPFNTLEMMEWQRIVRHRGHLQKLQDVHHQPIYSDEQMLTYLKQFERDFAQAKQTVIDATEGGLPKAHTTPMSLAEALDRYPLGLVPTLPQAGQDLDPDRLAAAGTLLKRRRGEVAELNRLSRKTLPLLRKMKQHQRDPRRMKRLFDQLEPIQKRVNELSEVFTMVNTLNTTGAFRRARSDRAIHHDAEAQLDEYQRQRRQLERDLENVDWLAQACEETLEIFGDALARIEVCSQPGSTPRLCENPVMAGHGSFDGSRKAG